jgi:hypothetical protein
VDKRLANAEEMGDMAPKKLSKKQQLDQLKTVSKTKEGYGSRAWWKAASKAERKVALLYRYLLSNGKWYSGLDLLFIDPDVHYIPPQQTKKGDGWYGVRKFRSSTKAKQEATMDEEQLEQAKASDDAQAQADRVARALDVPPGYKLVPVVVPKPGASGESVPTALQLPPRTAKEKAQALLKQAALSKPKPKKKTMWTKVLKSVIENFPGSAVQDPTDSGSSLQGSVLTATVVERVKKGKAKGKYRLQISGVVPSGKGGKYVERDDLQLVGSQYVTAETIKKYRLFTEDQAADYLVTG